MKEYNLEISSRQSGKTTRLLQQLFKSLELGKRCYLVTDKMSRFLSLETTHPSIFNHKNFYVVTPDMIDNMNTRGYIYEPCTDDWFYDEFDYNHKLTVAHCYAGYYYTTPRFLRTAEELKFVYSNNNMDLKNNDVLVEILNRVDLAYDSVVNPRLLDPKYLHAGKDARETQLGIWFK